MQRDDPQRLAAVRGSGLMVGRTDAAFDRAARTAARCTDAPVALVTVVGSARQHFIGQFGLVGELATRRGTPLSTSRCRVVVDEDGPVVACDTATHPLLAPLPPIEGLVIGAYLGVPLRDPDGVTLGAVCVISPTRHDWAEGDLLALEDVASFLQAHLTLRMTTQALRGLSAATPPTRRRPRTRAGCRTLPLPPRRR